MTAPDDALAAIEARAAAASPGPWIGRGFGPNDTWVRITQPSGWPDDPVCDVGNNVSNRNADADFIAHAREDIPALLATIRTLAAQHAADVAAAVDAASRSTREACAAQLRARAECLRRYAADAVWKADATEYTHDASEVDACAAIVASVAIAAPTGGGE